MIYARIEGGKVFEVIPPITDSEGAVIPIQNRFHPDFVAMLVECPEGTQQGYIFNDGQFLPPPPPTQPTHAELVEQAKAATRIQRQPIITVLDGLQASCLVKGETTRAQAIETAKQGLRDITDTDLSACMTYEDMRQTIKHAYAVLAAALPVDIRKAFSEAIS